jgi:signal transduction histidine kinase
MAVFVTWFVIVIAVRQVFSIGLKSYIKEKIIITGLLYRVPGAVKKLFRSLSEIDLTDSSCKSILRIILVNFIVLSICCSLWLFGILGLILYSFAVFILLNRYFNRTKKKYSILLNATSMMAKGNLEASMDEDIGVFEPLKQELAKVRFGFKKAVEEEMKSQKMKSELITNVSHDLKTPLTAIITYVNLLKEPDLTEEEKNSYIETIDKKSQRLKILIEDLFEISKAASNNVTLNLVEIDLSALIKQVLLELDDKIAGSEVEFRINLPADKVMLTLDSEKTYRIFENLIVNIIKYAMPHSRAYIDVEQQEKDVSVILKNISAEELDFNPDEIMERFVRGDKSRNSEGSGLGLAIVKSFVELQGGIFQIILDGDLFKTVIIWKRTLN